VLDVCRKRLATAQSLGYAAETRPRKALAGAAFVLTCLPDGTVTERFLLDATVAAILGPEPLRIDLGTSGLASTRRIHAGCAAAGAPFLDAPINGSSAEVRRGEGVVMAGGDAAHFDRARRLLEAIGGDVRRVGGAGAGAAMKLVTTCVLGLHRLVLAEGLVLAGALGITPADALEVLRAGPTRSRVMDGKGRRMVERDWEPEARLRQHAKDVRLVLEAAGEAGLRLPLSELHRSILLAAEVAGLGELDNSAVLQAVEAIARGTEGAE
jgi:3-hydroxyisobutyrate dehydrogenase-like beta-hydroxyacid dehydrogenase